ncbi:MAG TPA: hypothetical protein VK461_16505, partial [Acidimicrobiales bacterium]|nr:hypothetical protein [Acidimicrobiales bacterium]
MVEDEYVIEILDRAGGELPSAKEALAHLTPRIRRAHRRRAALRGSAALVALVVLGGIVSSATKDPSRDVRVGSTGTTAAADSSTTSVAPSTTLGAVREAEPQTGSPTTASGAAPSSGSGGGTGTGGGGGGATASEATAARPAPARPSTANHAGNGVGSSKGVTAGAVTSTSVVTSSSPAPQTTSFDAQAGTIEVQYTDSSMNLSSVLPSPGWSVAETKSDGSNIEVSFVPESGDG